MSTEIVQKAVAEYFAATRAMDAERCVAVFAEDATSHDPVGAPAMSGHAVLREFFQGITAQFEQVGLTEEYIFINGDEAAVKWTGRGVGKNKRKVSFEGIDIIKVNAEGKIQTLHAYWNPNILMAQLQ